MIRLSQLGYIFNRAAFATALLALAAPGCTDEGEPKNTTSSGSGGTGGAGGATTTTNGGSGGSTSSGGSGGMMMSGGSGGSGGSTSSGGTGGAAVTCLPDSATSALFTIVATDVCAIAVYTAEEGIMYQQPSWGTHGGPLLVSAGPADGDVTLSRWTPPAGESGKITIAKSNVTAKIPKGAFAGAEALDLGFRAGTAISYSGAFPDTAGELIIAINGAGDERYPVNGLFSMAVLPAAGGSGRLVYTGLSPVGDATAGPNGLYAADDCSGSFTPKGACAASIKVSAWGDNSGPAVADTQGNVITVMTNNAGDQECRAFAASAIAKGAGATDGNALFTLPGFGQALGVIAPTASDPGIVAFQPSDAMSFEALDISETHYSVASGKVSADDKPSTLITFPMKNTAVAMLTDPEDHLWVGVPTMTGTTFAVLARKPK